MLFERGLPVLQVLVELLHIEQDALFLIAGLLEGLAHLVESRGELSDLVPRRNRDLLVQEAGGDPLGMPREVA